MTSNDMLHTELCSGKAGNNMKTASMQSWRGFRAGQKVIMLIKTRGATSDDREIMYPPGSLAIVSRIADFGAYQGRGVDLIIGDGDNAICNSFDERDVNELGHMPFRHI